MSLSQTRFQVDKIIAHEKFDRITSAHDIALVRTIEHVAFSDYIQPACLWNDDTIPDVPGQAVGFGVIGAAARHDGLNSVLGEARMPIVSKNDCLQSNRPYFGQVLAEYNYCAGYRNG